MKKGVPMSKKPYTFKLFCLFNFILLSMLNLNLSYATTHCATPTGTGTGACGSSPASLVDAVSLAIPGDTIRLAPGTFTLSSTLSFNNDNVKVIGSGVGSTTIDCNSLASGSDCIEMVGMITSSFEVSHLTIDSTNTVGITAVGTDPTVSNIKITGTSDEALYLEDSESEVKFSVIEGKSISLRNSSAIIHNNILTGDGGGYGVKSMTEATGHSRNKVIKNTLTNFSTAAYFDNYGYDYSIIHQNRIDDNNVGIFFRQWAGLISNNLINNNSMAIYIGMAESYNARIVYNTIADNNNLIGMGIYNTAYDFAPGNTFIANNIIYGHSKDGISNVSWSDPMDVGYNLFYSNSTDIDGPYNDLGGNLYSDPLFIGSGNYRLQPGSPAINAASVSLFWLPVDLVNTSRMCHPKDPTPCPDMGCYEKPNF